MQGKNPVRVEVGGARDNANYELKQLALDALDVRVIIQLRF